MSLNSNMIRLRSIIIIQNRFREIKTKLELLTEDIIKIKNFIHSIMMNIQNNYNNDFISKTEYNKQMEDISNINILLNKLPKLPLTFSSLQDISILNMQLQKTYIIELIEDICKNTGMVSIANILRLYCGSNWLNTVSTEFFNLIVFYDKYVNIINVNIIDKKNRDEIEEIIEIAKNDNIDDPYKLPFCTRSYPTVTKSFLEKVEGIRLFIPFGVEFIKIIGIFKNDSLNLAKNDLPFRDKYNNILKKLEHIKIPTNFKQKYLEQISLRDFVSNYERDILNKIKNNYNDLQRLKDKSLSQIVKEFVKSTLEKQRKIIILLLLSENIEEQFLAHIVYDMISNNSYLLKLQPNSDCIYKSLHWSIQKNFKTSLKRIENEQRRLKNFSEEDISYDKRIALLKTSDKVKSKAHEKLKEMQGTKESSSKAQHYLDGLLKIPFGIYKKESILTFLDDFKLKLETTIPLLYDMSNKMEDNELKKLVSNIKNIYKCSNINTENDVNKYMNQLIKLIDNLENDLVKTESEDSNNTGNDSEHDSEHDSEYDSEHDLENNSGSDQNNDEQNITYNVNKKLVKECVNKIKHIQEIRKVLKEHDVCSVESLKRLELELKEVEAKLGIRTENEIKKHICKNVNKIYDNIDELIQEWNNYKQRKRLYLKQVRETLDKCVHGHDECKSYIEKIIGQWMNGKMEGTVFGLQGPPGVGKTSIAKKGIAKCLIDVDGHPRPFCFLPLGGSSNGSTLEGHNYTYLGSTWGKIIDLIKEAKCMNPIIYIDEVDKISNTARGNEISSILTHLTDPSQNSQFNDRYFSGIDFDLSKVIFIFSYNDRNKIDRILLDRITEIKVKAIGITDKIKIAKYYLMPEILEQVGFKKDDILINKSEIKFIIENYTFEAGVRKLKEKLYEIVRDVNFKKILNEEIKLPYLVTQENIEEIFSNNNKVIIKKCAKYPHVGMINGLYATSMGTGGLTIIEVHKTVAENKLALELTGSQGDVMKESMKVAKTLAWNVIPDEIKQNINTEWEDTGSFGLHIHCPEGATPKDGPSAGTAITCAIISRLCNLKIKNDVALTGEINLRGNVTAIGGVGSKVDGAKRAGAKKVLLPIENKQDYEKYIKKYEDSLLCSGEFTKEHIRKQINSIEVVFVEKLEDVFPHVFVENDLKFNFS